MYLCGWNHSLLRNASTARSGWKLLSSRAIFSAEKSSSSSTPTEPGTASSSSFPPYDAPNAFIDSLRHDLYPTFSSSFSSASPSSPPGTGSSASSSSPSSPSSTAPSSSTFASSCYLPWKKRLAASGNEQHAAIAQAAASLLSLLRSPERVHESLEAGRKGVSAAASSILHNLRPATESALASLVSSGQKLEGTVRDLWLNSQKKVLASISSKGRQVSTPETCAASCVLLVSTFTRAHFKAYHAARLFTIEMPAPYAGAPPLVLIHGYGSGAGLWMRNLDALSKHHHVFAVDLLGCGASERPPFSARSVKDAEDWFLDSLGEWRASVGLGSVPINIVGHSLGGYISAAYALREPRGSIASLILASPAGIPTAPEESELSRHANRWLMSALRYAWETDITIQGIVRNLGPFGKRFAADIISKRYQHFLTSDTMGGATLSKSSSAAGDATASSGSSSGGGVGRIEGFGANQALNRARREAFVRYVYEITVGEGSGEYALSVLLKFGAHAKVPMGPRIIAHVQGILEDATAKKTDMAPQAPASLSNSSASEPPLFPPTLFLYGGGWDWMDPRGGDVCSRALRSLGVESFCALLPHSGHNLFIEQPQLFANWTTQHIARSKTRDGQGGWGQAQVAAQHYRQ